MKRVHSILLVTLFFGAAGTLLVSKLGDRTERKNLSAKNSAAAISPRSSSPTHSEPLSRADALKAFERQLAKLDAPLKAKNGWYAPGFRRTLNSLVAADLERYFWEWSSGEEATVHYQALLLLLVERWAVLNPGDAWTAVNDQWSDALDAESRAPLPRAAADSFEAALQGWAKNDAAAAFAAFLTHRAEVTRLPDLIVYSYLDRLPAPLLNALASVDPDQAWQALDELGGEKETTNGLLGFYSGLPLEWNWAMEAKRFRDDSTSEDHQGLPSGAPAAALARRWVKVDPKSAIEWYRNRPTGHSLHPHLPDVRAAALLGGLYPEQPQSALNWLQKQRQSEGNIDTVAGYFLLQASSLDAVTAVLPLIHSEEARYAFLSQQAAQLDPREVGKAPLGTTGFIKYMNWSPESLGTALEVADLTAEHKAAIQWVVENGSVSGSAISVALP